MSVMDAVAIAEEHPRLDQRFPLPWNSSSFLPPKKLATQNPSVCSLAAQVGFSDAVTGSASSPMETGNDESINHCCETDRTVDGDPAESRSGNARVQEGHRMKGDDVGSEFSRGVGAQMFQNESSVNACTHDNDDAHGRCGESPLPPPTDAPRHEGTTYVASIRLFSSKDCCINTDTPDSPQSESVSETCPSPVFLRSKTVPSAPSSSINCHDNGHNLVRSQTEKKGNEKKQSDAVRLSPSPAEKLSEREKKRLIENFVKIKNDGTVEVDVDQSAGIIPTLFDLDIPIEPDIDQSSADPLKVVPSALNIAMLIVGTRGDVQPFVAIGKRLKEKGHRVRLATHSNFRDFVTNNGLEFFPLGGDPKLLAQYMVKNKGFVPSGPSEISTQKKQLRAIMHSLLPACTRPDGPSGTPFVADAIIANPPAYGHVHVAEYLNVPVHIFFTMPWTPTYEFPHPLARVKQHAAYKMSYHVVDFLVWWAIRGLVNEFRVKELNLNPIYFNMNQGSIAHLPTGYIWSPHLVPKPKDWGPKVDVVGFCFLDLAKDYRPPEALSNWLGAGDKPVYVGFGSLPLENPKKMTEIIVHALQETNQRGIIDKGWGGLGDVQEIPDSIFLLENCPHDWLFPQCAAVVHHGGAGTTAAGLKAGCPTTIVPFFGDQPFWGERVHARGVGPEPIPVHQFTFEKLVDAIKFMLDEEVKSRALELAKQMAQEDGVEGAVDAFYKHWGKRSPQISVSAGPLNLFEAIIISLRRLWCLPWCFE